MKRLRLLVPALLFCITSYAQETWIVDGSHSNIRYEVGWEDISIRTGEFKVFEGHMTIDSRTDLSNATFHLNVDPKSVDAIAERLSERLRGERFLDVEKYPDLTYYSIEVKPTSDSTYISRGKITIHGVEKDQDVNIWFKGQKTGSRGQILALEASLKLNRKDFGSSQDFPPSVVI